MRKNTVQPGRQQMTVLRMRIACWVAKATNSPSEYVILTALPLQQLLDERTSMLCYTYTECLVTLYTCLYLNPKFMPMVFNASSQDRRSPTYAIDTYRKIRRKSELSIGLQRSRDGKTRKKTYATAR